MYKNTYIVKILTGNLCENYSYNLSLNDKIIYGIDETSEIVLLKKSRLITNNELK